MVEISNEKVQEVKIALADPSGLGVFGLAMVTLVASTQKLGLTSGVSFVLPWALILGAGAQLIACFTDFKLKNIFGATAFGGYGLFWLAMGLNWLIKMGSFGPELASTVDTHQLGVAFIGYLVFSLALTFAALNTTKVLFSILFLINFLFVALALDAFGCGAFWHKAAGVVEMAISILGFYGSAAAIINGQYKRVILPVGKKMLS